MKRISKIVVILSCLLAIVSVSHPIAEETRADDPFTCDGSNLAFYKWHIHVDFEGDNPNGEIIFDLECRADADSPPSDTNSITEPFPCTAHGTTYGNPEFVQDQAHLNGGYIQCTVPPLNHVARVASDGLVELSGTDQYSSYWMEAKAELAFSTTRFGNPLIYQTVNNPSSDWEMGMFVPYPNIDLAHIRTLFSNTYVRRARSEFFSPSVVGDTLLVEHFCTEDGCETLYKNRSSETSLGGHSSHGTSISFPTEEETILYIGKSPYSPPSNSIVSSVDMDPGAFSAFGGGGDG